MNRPVLLLAVCTTLSGVLAGPLDNWHSRTNFGQSSMFDIAYQDGVYVLANATPGRIITATNLVSPGSFAVHEVPTGKPRAVEYGAGRFVVACEGGPILSSTNGYDWVSHAASGVFMSMVYADGKFVAVGSRTAAVSSNGVDWVISQDVPIFASDVIYGNGVFLATGSITNATSADGISWQTSVLPSKMNFYTVGFGEGKFVGITTDSRSDNILISTDGINWNGHGRLELLRPGRIAFGNGYFVTGGGNARGYSDDGIAWTVVPSNKTEYHVEFVNATFIATGYQSVAQSDPVTQVMLSSAGQLEVRCVDAKRVRFEWSDLSGAGWEPVQEGEAIAKDGNASIAITREGSQRFFRAVVD